MNSWEQRWALARTEAASRITRSPISPRRAPQFGADPAVHYVSPQPVVVPQTQGGGTFSNAIMLILGGFAVGTIWGESLINKALGSSAHKSQ
jgi:hypothetical protein